MSSTGVAAPGATAIIPRVTDRVIVFVLNTGIVNITEPWFQIYLTGIDRLYPQGWR
jgi:hypothetical protein